MDTVTVKGIDIRLLDHGNPVGGKKVVVQTGDKVFEATTGSKTGVASFPIRGALKHGAHFDVVVDGKVVKSSTVPAQFERPYPVLPIDLSADTAALHGDQPTTEHDALASPHDLDDEEEEEDGAGVEVLFVVMDSDREPVRGAVVRTSDGPYVTDENGKAWIPFQEDRTKVEVTAPGFKPKTFVVYEDDEADGRVKIILDADVKKAAPVNGQKILFFTLVLAVLALIGYGVTAVRPQDNTLLNVSNMMADPTTSSIMKYSTLAVVIVIVIGRFRLGQWVDVLSAAVFLLVSAVTGWLSVLNELDPTIMAYLPADAAEIIEFLRIARWVVYFLAFGWMFWAAWSNTPDMSILGAVFDVLSFIVYTTDYRMGLPVSAGMDQFELAMALKMVAAGLYMADMFQLPQMLLKKEVKPRFDPIAFGILTIALFVGLLAALQPGLALFFATLSMGLFTEMLEEVTRNYDPDTAPLKLGKMIQFVKTNKADGVALAASIVTLLSWFGVVNVIAKAIAK